MLNENRRKRKRSETEVPKVAKRKKSPVVESKLPTTKKAVENTFSKLFTDLYNSESTEKEFKAKISSKDESIKVKLSSKKKSVRDDLPRPSADNTNLSKKKRAFKAKKSIKVECEETEMSPATSDVSNKLNKKKKAFKAKKSLKLEKEEINISPTKGSGEENSPGPSVDQSNIKLGKKKKALKAKNPSNIKSKKSVISPTAVENSTKSPGNSNNIKGGKKKKFKNLKKSLQTELEGEKFPKKNTVVKDSTDLSNDLNDVKLGKKKKAFKPESPVDDEEESEDEASVEGEDDDNAENLKNEEVKKEKRPKRIKNDKNIDKTIFVGNLPVEMTRKDLHKLFIKVGPIATVRLRGAIPTKLRISKKVAEIKKEFHETLHSRKGFVVFKSPDLVDVALRMNGTFVSGHHIIVDKAPKIGEKKTYNNARSVFVGNLPFHIDDEQIWSAFSKFGEVEAVRVIRDKDTGAGKGFGYVLFTNKEGTQAALNGDGLEIEGRKVRIKMVEGRQKKPQSKNAKNFARRQALKAKKMGENPQSRKSSKKLIKKFQAENNKKKIAQAFKKFM